MSSFQYQYVLLWVTQTLSVERTAGCTVDAIFFLDYEYCTFISSSWLGSDFDQDLSNAASTSTPICQPFAHPCNNNLESS